MKLFLPIIVFFTIGLINKGAVQSRSFQIATFKEVPDYMMGCGDDCYLSAKDEKKDILICRTDYANALIRINYKSILLKANEHVAHEKNENIYSNEQYILTIKKINIKQTGSEDYTFKGVITIKSGSKVLYQQQIIGDGGC
ncbi:MAG TPA: hypothetical protein VGI43_19240 [Mucilaginibacter sp.]